MTDKQTKRQRLEQAREEARLAREKREKRQRTLKWLVPTSVSLAIVLIAALVVTLVVVNQPKPTFPNGPQNMASDGIVFTGESGEVTATSTDAIAKGDKPTATDWAADDSRPHVVQYIDWACPICKQFEEAYAEGLSTALAADAITLEVHPVAITDRAYTGDRYSSRINNAAACVANYAPDKFLEVQSYVYENQPEEQGPGLSNAKIVDQIHAAGLTDSDVDTCITSERFKPWVTAATDRTTSDPDLQGDQGFGTPTTTVDGEIVASADFGTFLQSAIGG